MTKDNDFAELAVLRRGPPKVVWLRTGNCSTPHVEQLLRKHAAALAEFADASDALVLELFS